MYVSYVAIWAQIGANWSFIFDPRGRHARKFPVPNPKIQDAKPENKSCSPRKLLRLKNAHFTYEHYKKLSCPKLKMLCPKIRPVLPKNIWRLFSNGFVIYFAHVEIRIILLSQKNTSNWYKNLLCPKMVLLSFTQ